jgi:branched-chain amino acid transport system substrate-binding protein
MHKHNTRLGALSLLTVGAVLLSACGADPTPTVPAPTATARASTTDNPPPVAATATKGTTGTTPTTSGTSTSGGGGEVKIGFAFITSGDNAVYGTSQKAAAQLAIDEINKAGDGPKITPIFEDTASKPDQAFTVFQKFINSDKVDAIIGPTLSNEAQTADPEAQKDAVPVLAVSNTASGITDIGDYIFRDSLSEAQVIPETVKEAKDKLNLTKVSLMYANDDAFSKSGADVFRAELQKNGITILSEQTFSTSDVDFKAQLNAVKADNPDAIVVSALAKPAQLIMQQARNDVGIDPKIHIIGGNGFNSPAVVTAAGPAAEGMIVGAAWNLNSPEPLSQKFIGAYKAATGKNPDQFAAQAYSGVYIMYDAIKRADIEGKSLADARTAIRDALKGTSSVDTVLGKFSFTDARDANHTPVVQIVKDGAFDVLK